MMGRWRLGCRRPLVRHQGARSSSAFPAKHSPFSPERPSACSVRTRSFHRRFGEEPLHATPKSTKSYKSRKLQSWKREKKNGRCRSPPLLPPCTFSPRFAGRCTAFSPPFSPLTHFSLTHTFCPDPERNENQAKSLGVGTGESAQVCNPDR